MKPFVLATRLTAAILCLNTIFMEFECQANVYSYVPDSPLHLGYGYDPFEPNDGKLPCVVHEGVVPLDSNGAISTYAHLKTVRSREEFYNMVNFSSSLSGSSFFASGHANVNMEDRYAFQEDSFSWVLLFQTDYGGYGLKGMHLDPALSSYDDDEIYRRCGTEIVTSARKAVMAYALFTVHNLSKQQLHHLQDSFDLDIGGFGWGAGIKASYESLLQTASSYSDLSITVYAIGGAGASQLANLALVDAKNESSGGRLQTVPRVLQAYIATLTADKAAPVQYTTTKISDFNFKRGFKPTLNSFKDGQVSALYLLHRAYAQVVERLQEVLGAQGESAYEIDAAKRTELENSYRDYSEAMNEVFAAGEKCLNPNTQSQDECRLPQTRPAPVKWPKKKLNEELCSRMRAQTYQSGLLSDRMYALAEKRNLMPVIVPDQQGRSKIEGLYSCRDYLETL